MEEEKKLYPFRFCTLQDDYSWGSESFMLADLGYRDSLLKEGWLAGNAISEVMDMYLDRVVGEKAFAFYGRQFPVCARLLKVSGRMPLRVSPDDEIANDRYDFLGKEKLWYVSKAGKGAGILLGFKENTDATAIYTKCLDNSVESLMNRIEVKAGDFFRIAPGVPHAADGDMTIIEIAESSPLDFCLCGWGVPVSDDEFDTSLNLIDALDFIDYRAWRPDEKLPEGQIVSLPQFKVDMMRLPAPVRVKAGEPEEFSLYTCVSGAVSVQVEVLGQTASYAVSEGETVLVPAECEEFILAPTREGTVLLETTVPAEEARDAYINPEVEEKIPGEDYGDSE